MDTAKGPDTDRLRFSPLEIRIPPEDQRGNIEKYIRIFKTTIIKEKVMSELKTRQSYEKPSEKKRRKHRESLQRQRKLDMLQARIASGETEPVVKKRNIRIRREDDEQR